MEGWERLELESWLRTACLPAAASLLGISYSLAGVERQRCVAYFGVFFDFPAVLGFVVEVAFG